MKNRTPRKPRTANLATRGIGNLPFSYLVVIAICGCVIAAGFLLAARQHFMSMDLGMKNSKLRKQLEDLETEHRRLLLAREVALSPKEITRAARGLGFSDTLEQTLAMPVPVATLPSPVTAAKPSGTTNSTRGLTRTAYQRPVQPVAKSEATKKAVSNKASKNG